ncbi:MAG: hypothetical protein EOS61_14940 [Mesorhizobium sp.]|nr:MAG: hypothetical protein EOS61_14940 [Mesorhizobium sp.]
MSLRIIFAVAMIATLVSSLAFSAEAEGWANVEIQDPTNAEVVTAAIVTNDQGFSIAIFRSKDGKVRWTLGLPKSSFDSIKTSERVAVFRVDDHDATDLNVSPGDEDTRVLGRSVLALLWHGSGPTPTRGILRNVLDGRTLTVRFYLDNGGSADTNFDLAGAADSIAPALGISAQADPELLARELDRNDAILKALTACETAPSLALCQKTVRSCLGDTDTTGEMVRACIADHRSPIQ